MLILILAATAIAAEPPAPELPGGEIDVGKALAGGELIAAATAASLPVIKPGREIMYVRQHVKVARTILGDAPAGQTFELNYTYDPQRQRPVKINETVIWIAAAKDGKWHGLKAVEDTPAGRVAVVAAVRAAKLGKPPAALSVELELTAAGAGGKDLSGLRLTTDKSAVPTGTSQLVATISPEQAAAIVDFLVRSGWLGQAEDVTGKKPAEPTSPVYVLSVGDGTSTFALDLGWGPALREKLQSLREVLGDSAGEDPSPAGEALDKLWARLAELKAEPVVAQVERPKPPVVEPESRPAPPLPPLVPVQPETAPAPPRPPLVPIEPQIVPAPPQVVPAPTTAAAEQGITGRVVLVVGSGPKALRTPLVVPVHLFSGRVTPFKTPDVQHRQWLKSVRTDSDGRFRLPLMPGAYTVVAEIGGRMYLNRYVFGGPGYWQATTVTDGEWSEVTIEYARPSGQ